MDSGASCEHGYADGLFEGVAFVVEAVFTEGEPVVAEVENERVLGEICVVEVLEQMADVFIEAVDGFAEVPVEFVEVGYWVMVEGAGLHMVDSVDAVATFPDPVGLGGIVVLGIGHGFRVGDGFALVAVGVAWGWGEGEVYGFIGEVEEEGFFVLLLSEPLDGLGGEDIGVIASEGLVFAVDVEFGIEVGTLAFEADPVVEAGARAIVVVAHVPFADEGCLVSVFLEVLREEDCAGRDGALVIDHAVMVHVLAGEDGGAAGRAEGGGDEGIGEVGAFGGEPVEGGGFQPFRAVRVKAHEVVTVVVTQYEDDIGRGGVDAVGRE